MARIRTIKPSFWEDEIVGLLSREARLLFIASWTVADDEGLLRWTPEYLKSATFAYDPDVPARKVERLMGEVVENGLVFAYQSGRPPRQQLGYVVNFRRHQRINRPQPSSLPPPSIQSLEVKRMYGRRDRMICGICSGHIQEVTDPPCGIYSVPPDNHFWDQKDQQLSLDHIIPRAAGGTDYPSNIRASHVSCNKGRRDRPDGFIPPVATRTMNQAAPHSVNDAVNEDLTHSPPEGKGRDNKTPPTPPLNSTRANGQTGGQAPRTPQKALRPGAPSMTAEERRAILGGD